MFAALYSGAPARVNVQSHHKADCPLRCKRNVAGAASEGLSACPQRMGSPANGWGWGRWLALPPRHRRGLPVDLADVTVRDIDVQAEPFTQLGADALGDGDRAMATAG